MARYRKIDPRIWNDEKFASLSHEGQRAFLFILTHPSMTSLGAFRATKEGIEAELGIDPKGLAQPFHELLSKGLIKYDESCFLVFAPNFLKYNQPENPNVVKGWAGCLDLLPECSLLAEVLQRAKSCASANSKLSKAFSDSLGRVTETLSERYAKQLSKGLAIQEQEQEQEYIDVSNETSSSANANESESVDKTQPELLLNSGTGDRTAEEGQTTNEEPKPAKRNPPLPFQKVIDLYNAHCTPSLPSARLTDKRKDEIRLRWKDLQQFYGLKTEEETLAAFEKFFERVSESDFLNGRTDAAFRADLPWLLQREKFDATLNGRYDKRERTAIDRNGHKGTSPLPDHLNPHLRFDAAYYADAKKPDGTTDWGV